MPGMRACFVFGLNCLLCRERALVPAKAANMPTYRGPAVTRQVRMVWFISVMRTLPTELCARHAARAGAAGRATHFCAAAHDHRDERKWAAVPWVPRCVSSASADVHRRTDLGLELYHGNYPLAFMNAHFSRVRLQSCAESMSLHQ